MAVTMATADQALKILYLGVVQDQLNTKTNPLYNKIASTTENIVGKKVVKMAPYGINGGYGAGSETGALPGANGNLYANFESDTKNLFGTIEISDKSIEASKDNAGAFVSLLNAELDGLMKAAKFNLARQLFMDGTAKLATCGTTTASVTVNVASTQYLMEGMTIDILVSATGATITNGSARRIMAVDRTNKKIILDGSNTVTTDNTMAVYPQGSRNLELTGLAKIFQSTGTLYNLDRAANYWMIPSMNSTGGTISDMMIQAQIDYVEDISGGKINYISCSSGVRRAYQSYMEATKRTVNSMALEGGFSAISYNGIPLVSDKFEPSGTMDLLDTTQFKLHHMGDWRWLANREGSVLQQKAGYPIFTANLVRYAELICDHPGAMARISNITEA